MIGDTSSVSSDFNFHSYLFPFVFVYYDFVRERFCMHFEKFEYDSLTNESMIEKIKISCTFEFYAFIREEFDIRVSTFSNFVRERRTIHFLEVKFEKSKNKSYTNYKRFDKNEIHHYSTLESESASIICIN